MADDVFRARLFEGIQDYARLRSDPHICALWSDLRHQFTYQQLASTKPRDVAQLFRSLREASEVGATEGNILIYLATPPAAVPELVRGLDLAGVANEEHGWRRLVFEKPFRHDLSSARELNAMIEGAFSEEQALRIDHYLGKETVQNLLAFRFANTLFEPLWNREYVDHVQITVAEAIGIGQRAGYYNRAGVLRDIIQNHVLQLLALTAMEPPKTLDPEALRDEKARVLQAVRNVERDSLVLGQYAGYLKEEGVSPDSITLTYATLRLFIDNNRWRDVPFYLRSGKRLARKTTEITLQFRKGSHAFLRDGSPNRLSLRIQPDEGIQLQFDAKVPGAGMRARPEDMVFRFKDRYGDSTLPDAYERPLLDALQGDRPLFIGRDEVELAWGLVDPLLEDPRTPEVYKPGSCGPSAADDLLQSSVGVWLDACRPAEERT